MVAKVVLMKGLPGSGKTTRVKNEYSGFIRVNRDSIRLMLYGPEYRYTKEREKAVKQIRNAAIASSLRNGYNVVVDDTNLGTRPEQEITTYLDNQLLSYSLTVDETCLSVPLNVCIERDAQRSGSAHVGRKVIERMYNQHLKPQPLPRDLMLPSAVLVDIDGTLALMQNRHPYEWAKVGQDALNTPVANLVNGLDLETRVILMSGRSSVCRDETIAWLEGNGINFDRLYMRPEGDNRPDVEVKRELYLEHVKGRFNVDFVLDDRDSVVALWRGLGLSCFQVNYGCF